MQLLRRHDFAMIWFAGLVSYISGSMFIALPIWVFQQYGSATHVSIVAMASIVPSVALGSITGIFVDRWDRTRVMLIVTFVRIGWLLLLALAVRADWFWLVVVVRLGTATGMQFFGPAEQSLLPKLVESDAELMRANSLNQLNNNLGGIVGTGLGGVLLLWIGMDGIAILMAGLATISAVLVSRVRYADIRPAADEHREPATSSIARSAGRLASEWRDGVMLLVRESSIRTLVLILGVASVTNVGFNTLLPVFALETLEVNEAGVGTIYMVGAIGGLLGATLLGFLQTSTSPTRILQGSILAMALLDVAFYGYPFFTGGILLLSLAIIFFEGFPSAGTGASAMTLTQTHVPEHQLGRALGSIGSFMGLIMLIATPVSGVLADLFTAQWVLLGIAVITLLSWVLSLGLSRHSPRTTTAPQPDAIADG